MLDKDLDKSRKEGEGKVVWIGGRKKLKDQLATRSNGKGGALGYEGRLGTN